MNNHMSISVWGPLGWDWLHNLAICYPKNPTDSDRHFYYLKVKNFIESLPCEKCKQHAKYYMMYNPIDLSKNKNFQYWVFHFHNYVNLLKKKKKFTINQYCKKYRINLPKI